MRPRNEHTIAAPCEVSGRGYWSGQRVTVRFKPAEARTGIRLIRTDLPGCPSCPATAAHRDDESLRTNVSLGAAKFQLIEHMMAALYALEIDNCLVEIDGEEFPGLDGSSDGFVRALESVGLVVQAAARSRYFVDRFLRVGDANSWIEVSPVQQGPAVFEYHLDYGDQSPVAKQSYRVSLTPEIFRHEVAQARTFVTLDQAQTLRRHGVAAHVTNADLLVFDADGVVDNALRYSNECARHKALDLIGDLALAGVDLVGQFVSHRGGHRLNGQLASLLTRYASDWTMTTELGSQSAPPHAVRGHAA